MPDASLPQTIDALWILDPALARELRAKADIADDSQTEVLTTLVKTIETEQNNILEKLVQADPAFPQKLGEFLRQSLQSTKGDVAAADAADLSSLGSQIDAL